MNIIKEERCEWSAWMTRRALLKKPVHRWFTFPHSFTSELVHALIDEWELTSHDLILDPFVGAGTTILSAKERGIPAKGYDISPLADLVSRVKVSDYEYSSLKSLQKSLDHKFNEQYKSNRKLSKYPDLLMKALPGTLLRHFSDYARALDDLECADKEKEFFKLALIAIIPFFSRAKATGGWIKWIDNDNDASIFHRIFSDQIEKMIADVSTTPTSSNLAWHIHVADARSIPDDDNTYTALITSPPYPNRHDYTRIFGVELMFGFLTWEQIRQLRYKSLQSHPESRPNRTNDDGYSPPLQFVDVLSNLNRDGADPRICRMLDGYFRDIYQCLREAARVCKPGAKLAFILGNVQYGGYPILVDELTAELGEEVGLECKKIYVARYRGNSAQQMGKYGRQPSREAVVIFECC